MNLLSIGAQRAPIKAAPAHEEGDGAAFGMALGLAISAPVPFASPAPPATPKEGQAGSAAAPSLPVAAPTLSVNGPILPLVEGEGAAGQDTAAIPAPDGAAGIVSELAETAVALSESAAPAATISSEAASESVTPSGSSGEPLARSARTVDAILDEWRRATSEFIRPQVRAAGVERSASSERTAEAEERSTARADRSSGSARASAHTESSATETRRNASVNEAPKDEASMERGSNAGPKTAAAPAAGSSPDATMVSAGPGVHAPPNAAARAEAPGLLGMPAETGMARPGLTTTDPVAAQIAGGGPRGVDHVTIPFEGEHGLEGRLRVALRGSALHATIVTPDRDTAARIEGALGELHRALVERGFGDVRLAIQSSAAESRARHPDAGEPQKEPFERHRSSREEEHSRARDQEPRRRQHERQRPER